MAANVDTRIRARGTGSTRITTPDGATTRLEVTPTQTNLTGNVSVAGVVEATVNDPSVDTMLPVLSVVRKTTGVAAAGIGASIGISLESANGTVREAVQLGTMLSDATNGSEDARIGVSLIRNGVLTLLFSIQSDGKVAISGPIGVNDASPPAQAAHIANVTQSADGALGAVDLTTGGGKEVLLDLIQELQTKLEALRLTMQNVGFNLPA